MMTEEEFMDALREEGYDVFVDGVVMVRLDPVRQSAERLRKTISEVIGWTRSYGISYTSRPKEWDRPSAPPRPPVRDWVSAAKTQHMAKGPADEEQLPGQLSFEDVWGIPT